MFSKQQSSAWWKAKPREGRCDRPRECGPSVVYSDDASGPAVTRVTMRHADWGGVGRERSRRAERVARRPRGGPRAAPRPSVAASQVTQLGRGEVPGCCRDWPWGGPVAAGAWCKGVRQRRRQSRVDKERVRQRRRRTSWRPLSNSAPPQSETCICWRILQQTIIIGKCPNTKGKKCNKTNRNQDAQLYK